MRARPNVWRECACSIDSHMQATLHTVTMSEAAAVAENNGDAGLNGMNRRNASLYFTVIVY